MDLMQVLLNPLLLSVVAAFAILLLFVGLSRASRSGEELIEERLDRYGVHAEDEKKGKGKERRSAMDGLEDAVQKRGFAADLQLCLLYTSPSPRDRTRSRMPSSA